MREEEALRIQLRRQLAHWQSAVVTLGEPTNFASKEAWAETEQYLGTGLRDRQKATVAELNAEVGGMAAHLASAQSLDQLELVRRRLLRFRQQYTAVETTLDFYGDALNTRTNPKVAAILRFLDMIASRSMEVVLHKLGQKSPPVLTYIDKGMGASILKAGIRLWDGGGISPVAAIKITRHNLYRPTSLIHETGHQVAHILGWTDEFALVLRDSLAPFAPREVVEGWVATASEVVADIFAFVHCGYGAVAALHDVVAAEEASVLRYAPDDPHPMPYIRVLLNVEYCKRMFGAGPWDHLATAWRQAHPLNRLDPSVRQFLEASDTLLPHLADLSLLRPLRAFGGKAIVDLVDPKHVRPENLIEWNQRLRTAVYTSPHFVSTEPIRVLALSSYQMATEPERAGEIAQQYEAYTQRFGAAMQPL